MSSWILNQYQTAACRLKVYTLKKYQLSYVNVVHNHSDVTVTMISRHKPLKIAVLGVGSSVVQITRAP